MPSPNNLRTELAWAAGFFDGEGSVCAAGDKRRRIQITIGQNKPGPLERFKDIMGFGKVSPRRVGNIFHWQICGFELGQFVACLLWPYLSNPKREQFTKSFLSYCNRPKRHHRGGVHGYYAKDAARCWNERLKEENYAASV